MQNTKPSSTTHSKIAKYIPALMLGIALLGFADATYLTIEHVRGTTPNCSILEGCDTVTTSKYSEIFGIPVALGGSLYYLVLFLLLVSYFDAKKEWLLDSASMLTPLGLLASLWFVYLQLFVIQAICIYCMGSAITSTLLFIFGLRHLCHKGMTPKKIFTTYIAPHINK